MAISKIVYKSSPSATPVTWMDATTATAAAADITSPKTAMLADGVMTTGTGTGGGEVSVTIEQLPGGGEHYIISGDGGDANPTAEEKDVNFIDYDGTIRYSYTIAEAQALTELPANPSHNGLVAQGWNWTLADMKEYVNAIGGLIIGQLYIPSDGATHIDIIIEPTCPINRRKFSLVFKSSISNNVIIDWGDGETQTAGNTSVTAYEHSYSAYGEYSVKLTVNSGSITLNGATTGTTTAYTNGAEWYKGLSIQSIMIGNGVSELGRYAFREARNLSAVTLPNAELSFNYSPFYNSSISCLIIPEGVRVVHNACFGNLPVAKYVSLPKTISITSGYGTNIMTSNNSVKMVFIPPSITELPQGFLGTNYMIKKLTIPSQIASIGMTALTQLTGISEYHLLPTTPPTLDNTNAFLGIPSDCVIYVPYSSDHSILNAYQTATNWSTYASYMQEEPQS